MHNLIIDFTVKKSMGESTISAILFDSNFNFHH